MGNMEWVIGLGALAIGGWCFLAGPCKGWLGQLTNGGGNNFSQTVGASLPNNRFANNPAFINDFNKTAKEIEGLSEAQAKLKIEQNLGKYKSNYVRLAI